MKKNRGDEPIGVVIHIYMEISQGNSLCNYLYLEQTKMSFFLQNQRAEGGKGFGTSGRGEVVGKGLGR
jgi:hypothetical protein